MAYSLIEQETLDLNIYFKDNSKCIFLASAGGQLPQILVENDIRNEQFDSEISRFETIFEIEIAENLRDFIQIDDLEMYLDDFILMAKRGFYAYDKTNLGKNSDQFFHLVAKPKQSEKLYTSSQTENLIKIDVELPIDFISFDLFSILK